MALIGIIETGRPAPAAVERFGDAPKMFRHYFASEATLDFKTFPVVVDGLIPSPDDCEGWIITGSRHGVYDKLPWMTPLKEFILATIASGKPLLGVCFGHQLMADAFGGTVEKSPKGRGMGIHHHRLTTAGKQIFTGVDELALMAAHQDQVVVPPANGIVLAGSDFCPYAAFAYGKNGLSMQSHPEILAGYEEYLIEDWPRRGPVSPQIVQTALKSLETEATNAELIKPVLSRFLANA